MYQGVAGCRGAGAPHKRPSVLRSSSRLRQGDAITTTCNLPVVEHFFGGMKELGIPSQRPADYSAIHVRLSELAEKFTPARRSSALNVHARKFIWFAAQR
jgi:hypothetical protein